MMTTLPKPTRAHKITRATSAAPAPAPVTGELDALLLALLAVLNRTCSAT